MRDMQEIAEKIESIFTQMGPNFYFYHLNQIIISPPLSNSDCLETPVVEIHEMKEALRKEYMILFDIHNQYLASPLKQLIAITAQTLITSPPVMPMFFGITEDVQKTIVVSTAKANAIFSCTHGIGTYSISKLRTEIASYAPTEINDKNFESKLAQCGIDPRIYSEYFKMRNIIYTAYQLYFQRVDLLIASMKQSLPTFNLTTDVFDLHRKRIVDLMDHDMQKKQDRVIIELMRAYTRYPELQNALLQMIYRVAGPQPIIKDNTQIGSTSTTNLAAMAARFEFEGLLPPHVQSLVQFASSSQQSGSPSTPQQQAFNDLNILDNSAQQNERGLTAAQCGEFNKAVQFFKKNDKQAYVARINLYQSTTGYLNLQETAVNEFSLCPRVEACENINDKQSAVNKVQKLLQAAITVDDFNKIFEISASYVNRHRHLWWDNFFGNKNTNTWQIMMKEIREGAFKALLDEVQDLSGGNGTKIQRLEQACKMPLFNEHKHNHWYTGAVGDTHTVELIKNEIDNLLKPQTSLLL